MSEPVSSETTSPQNAHSVKTEHFHFYQIEKYFRGNSGREVFQSITDNTVQDLDLEDVFRVIDRTRSRVGQQYLYHQMRTIPGDDSHIKKLENTIRTLKENPVLRNAVSKEISRLNSTNAYYIPSLFQSKYVEKPSWFWLIQLLAAASVCLTIFSLFFPKILVILIVLLPVNMGFHYWNKNNLYQYGSSIPQLILLIQIARKILRFKELPGVSSAAKKSADLLSSRSLQMSVFKIEAKLQSEIGQLVDYFLELIKALFLLEPLFLFSTLNLLDRRREDMENIFILIGETDAAISILSLRESLTCWCLPEIIRVNKKLDFKELYHPLIINGVSNDLLLDQKSALIMGSNMSGKTTFIRTVGINALLAQTINTCFAKEFAMPRMKICSSIRISDDLLNEKSYYFEEVLSMRELVRESRSETGHLFLLDELFKGTNTVERIAIAKSVLSYLTERDNIVLVATHDRELAGYLNDSFDLYHFTEIIEQHGIAFDYKIKPGEVTATNAIRILGLHEYPREIVDEAFRLAQQLRRQRL